MHLPHRPYPAPHVPRRPPNKAGPLGCARACRREGRADRHGLEGCEWRSTGVSESHLRRGTYLVVVGTVVSAERRWSEVLVSREDLGISVARRAVPKLTSLMILHRSRRYDARLAAWPASDGLVLDLHWLAGLRSHFIATYVVKPERTASKCTAGMSKLSTTEKCASTLISDGSATWVSSVAPSWRISYARLRAGKETRGDGSVVSAHCKGAVVSSPSPLRYSRAQNSRPVFHSSCSISFCLC